MKKRFLLVLAIAVSFLILVIGHSAIAQRATPAITALAVQAVAAQGAAFPGNTQSTNLF
jgi:hypothetical protein